jgi:hypothetical protein
LTSLPRSLKSLKWTSTLMSSDSETPPTNHGMCLLLN